ncbi:MAG: D-2-hydroxyacid dehydrogenase [Planctomycetes bacterium]|nr:D-2-hydroxyacid dehydrogenase [Planctomycetota bacterium]
MKILIYYPVIDELLFEQIREAAAGCDLVIARTLEEAQTMIHGAEVLFGHFPAELFAQRKGLRWIQSYSAGMDNFLYPAVIESDVIVTGASGCYGAAAADSAFAMLLAFTRGLVTRLRSVDGNERPARLVELEGMNLGILGLGGIGREMARRGRAFGMRVLGIDPVARDPLENVDRLFRPEQLDEILGGLDVLMSACALTPQSYHILDETRLRRMKPLAYLINISRGPIIDEAALLRVLDGGHLAGVGLDVTEVEPLPADSRLRQIRRVLLTHHTAGASQSRNPKLVQVFCENLGRYQRDEPLINLVDKKRGY